ncbi:sig-7, partial [Symbiodinium microadriaticum]
VGHAPVPGRAHKIAGDAPPGLDHTQRGTVSMAGPSAGSARFRGPEVGSQFFITLSDGPHASLDGLHTPIGQVVEGLETLDRLDEAFADAAGRPLVDIRIAHKVVLDDPLGSPVAVPPAPASPPPGRPVAESVPERLRATCGGPGETAAAGAAAADDQAAAVAQRERLADEETKSRAVVLEMVGDLPDADAAPPDNVLFVCKLNPGPSVASLSGVWLRARVGLGSAVAAPRSGRSADLEMIFSRFGRVQSCEILKDSESGESLCYAFVEFATKQACEEAFFKMNNVMIDNRRIKVDFSQSVARLWAQSRRGGAMPRMAAARAGSSLSQKGRIGGQVVDLRIKRSALGSRAGAAAISARLAPPARAGPPTRAAADEHGEGPVDISKAIAAARAAAGKLADCRGGRESQDCW